MDGCTRDFGERREESEDKKRTSKGAMRNAMEQGNCMLLPSISKQLSWSYTDRRRSEARANRRL